MGDVTFSEAVVFSRKFVRTKLFWQSTILCENSNNFKQFLNILPPLCLPRQVA